MREAVRENRAPRAFVVYQKRALACVELVPWASIDFRIATPTPLSFLYHLIEAAGAKDALFSDEILRVSPPARDTACPFVDEGTLDMWLRSEVAAEAAQSAARDALGGAVVMRLHAFARYYWGAHGLAEQDFVTEAPSSGHWGDPSSGGPEGELNAPPPTVASRISLPALGLASRLQQYGDDTSSTARVSGTVLEEDPSSKERVGAASSVSTPSSLVTPPFPAGQMSTPNASICVSSSLPPLGCLQTRCFTLLSPSSPLSLSPRPLSICLPAYESPEHSRTRACAHLPSCMATGPLSQKNWCAWMIPRCNSRGVRSSQPR